MYTFVVTASLSSTYSSVRPGTRLRVGLLAAARGIRPKAESSNLNANRCRKQLFYVAFFLVLGNYSDRKLFDNARRHSVIAYNDISRMSAASAHSGIVDGLRGEAYNRFVDRGQGFHGGGFI